MEDSSSQRRLSTQRFFYLRRSCYCGEVRKEEIGKELVLKGWVESRRDHGGLIFVDLRDRTGICQVVFDPQEVSAELFQLAHSLKDEYVLGVRGAIRARPPETENPQLPTGEVELRVQDFEILNTSLPLPFPLDEYQSVREETRLKFRYLDLRRPPMQRKLFGRSQLYKIIRDYLAGQGFIEVETPILTRSTPEGARDFLVPSRLNPGTFYALPQSPQLFKQILMVSGFDRYFQLARCFRDEDFRANRQPEFTQIDIEMSFIMPDDLFEVMEGMMQHVFKEMWDREIETPFPRIPYDEAMLRYGCDNPDLRFGMPIHDFTQLIDDECSFEVFKEVKQQGGLIRGLVVSSENSLTRKQLDELTHFVGQFGASGLAWMKCAEPQPSGPVAKFFSPALLQRIKEHAGIKTNDLVLMVAGEKRIVCQALANLRLHLGQLLKLIEPKALRFCWIVDFPLLEWNEEEQRWQAAHHPFTSPVPEDIPLLENEPENVRAIAYDLVLNGEEIAGGSIRIHNKEIQEKVFKVIGLGEQEAQEKFGFLLEALRYGAPPHGGIAFGFDRLVMIVFGEENIREIIAFPKTQSGICLMSNAPGQVSARQLKELYIKLDLPEEE